MIKDELYTFARACGGARVLDSFGYKNIHLYKMYGGWCVSAYWPKSRGSEPYPMCEDREGTGYSSIIFSYGLGWFVYR